MEKNLHSDSQMGQSSWQEEIRSSEHPPQFRITLHEEIHLHVPKERSFPVSPKYIGVVRRTNRTLDVSLISR